MPSGNPQYILWRQDDNGNSIAMCRFHSRKQADRVCRQYQARGHKQLYWVTVLSPKN